MRLDLGGRTHPRQVVDRRGVGLHQVVDQLHHARLVRRREVLGHVDLADRLAHRIVERAHRAFPARPFRLGAAHRDVVELEARVAHVGRQLERHRVHQVHAQVGLPDVQRLGLDELVQRPEIARLADRDEGRVDQLASHQVGLPVDVGRLGGDLRHRHRVVGLDRIAVGLLRPLDARDPGLQVHDRGGLHRRVLAALRGQQRAQVGDVGLARLGETLVLLQVVVAIAEAESALSHAGRIDRRILGVGADAQAHRQVDEGRPRAHQRGEILARLDGVDLRQVRPQRTHAGGVDGGRVHVAGVEVADLGVDRAHGLRLGRQSLDDRLHALVGQVVELREGAVVGLVGGDRRVLQPGAVHREEQAVLRTHAGVHAGLVQPRGHRAGDGHRRGGGGIGGERQVGREGQRQGDDDRRGTEGIRRHGWSCLQVENVGAGTCPALPLARPERRSRERRIRLRRAARGRPPRGQAAPATVGAPVTRGEGGRPGPSTSCRPPWCRRRRGSRRC